jgi:ABC-type nickel/cobalt efflux system permease component RcnA
MLILGLLLILVSVAAAVLLVAYNTAGGPEQMIVLFGRDLVSVNPLQAFLAGIAVALVFCLGLWLVVSSGRRARAARADYRAMRREARTATRERDQLAGQLERERATNETAAAQPVAAAPPVAAEETTRTTTGRRLGRHWRRSRDADEPAEANERTTSR